MPEETDEQRQAREDKEAADKAAADKAAETTDSGDTQAEIDAAKDEAAKARKEAEDAKAEANSVKADAAEARATAADERAATAEAKLKDAEKDKTFPKEAVDKLRKEAAGHRTKANELKEELQKVKDAAKSEQQRLEERASTAEGRADKAEKSLVRLKVAQALKLPEELAERLVGETEDELKEDGKKLLKLAGGGTSSGGGLDQGPRGGGAEAPKNMNDWLRRGRQSG